jgi:hypothetical protein
MAANRQRENNCERQQQGCEYTSGTSIKHCA